MKRTKYCGEFNEFDIGKSATAMGWIYNKRDMGGVFFVDLRDREGTLQVVFNMQDIPQKDFERVKSLKCESVISVSGIIHKRDIETYNPNIKTGTIELRVSSFKILSESKNLPFSIDDNSVREDKRMKYRYLDLRRPKMLNNIRFRHNLLDWIQKYLNSEGFISVETPILTKSTPEGARDYLVPSRIHKGSFYALPQSPQIFKQILMVGGIDKYYQVARCFRDEDLRADRQPEFTQVDIEMSFIEQEDILCLLEGLFKSVIKNVMGREINGSFPRMTYKEAMDTYGSDKPDLRFGLPIVDLSEIASKSNFSVFRNVCLKGGVVRAINVRVNEPITRTTIELLTKKSMDLGAKGMAWIALKPDGEINSILTKFLSSDEINGIIEKMDAKPGDLIIFCADDIKTVSRVLGSLRLYIGDLFSLKDKNDLKFLIVTDFPQFEYSEEEKRYISTHHPFTMPYPEDVKYLLTEPDKVRAQAYDFVLNGVELGSGSIRIHNSEIQQKMFEALGFTEKEIKSRFGFLINAFKYGTPPHGGFAFGLDRLAMLLLGVDSLRDVIAFPKTKDATCLLTDAPDAVSDEQLEVLGLSEGGAIIKQKEKKYENSVDVGLTANLAKLSFPKEEMKRLENEMKEIIAFANKLNEIDTSNVPETAHILPIKNVFREDKVYKSIERDELLSNAPICEDGYFFVPKVVGKDDE